jgi:hypothetical protein
MKEQKANAVYDQKDERKREHWRKERAYQVVQSVRLKRADADDVLYVL